MEIKRQVVKGIKWTTISTVVLALSSIIKISVLTRYLEPSDFGLIAIVVFILGFMELFNDMGLTTAILHEQSISLKEYSSLYWLNLLVSLILFFLLYAISPLISNFYNQEQLLVLIPLSGLNLIFSGIGRQFRVIEQKKLLFKEISIVEIITSIISLMLAIFMAIWGFGVFAIVYSALIQGFLLNLIFLVIGIRKQKILFHYNYSETKKYLKIGVYQVGGQIINYFNRDLDVLIIGKFFPVEILGGYSLAKQLVFRPAQIINPILTKVASPTLALMQKGKEKLKESYLKLIRIVSSLNFLVYSLLLIFAPLAVKILYGEGYDDIIILVRILCVYMYIRSIGNPVGSLVVASGRTDLEFYWNIITLLVTPLFVLFAAQFDIVFVPIFMVTLMVVLFVPSWKFLINRILNVNFNEYAASLTPRFCLKINK